jgi:HEPN domain
LRRSDLQKLARTRIKEARILLKAEAYDGAYYLLGLAVEAALKACIAKKTNRYDFPDKSVVNSSYSHDLSQLTSIAGLTTAVDAESKVNPAFAANWSVVLAWRIESRYSTHAPQKAKDLCKAVTDPRDGVMACIRRSW